jgi:hypothetical protein
MSCYSYNDYLSFGGELDDSAFNRNVYKALAVLNRETKGRLNKMAEMPLEAKTLLREMIDFYEKNSKTKSVLTSKSQSSNGVSESESYLTVSELEQGEQLETLITSYLMSVCDDNGTPLLYRGCKR